MKNKLIPLIVVREQVIRVQNKMDKVNKTLSKTCETIILLNALADNENSESLEAKRNSWLKILVLKEHLSYRLSRYYAKRLHVLHCVLSSNGGELFSKIVPVPSVCRIA
jgi:hypothetical protein